MQTYVAPGFPKNTWKFKDLLIYWMKCTNFSYKSVKFYQLLRGLLARILNILDNVQWTRSPFLWSNVNLVGNIFINHNIDGLVKLLNFAKENNSMSIEINDFFLRFIDRWKLYFIQVSWTCSLLIWLKTHSITDRSKFMVDSQLSGFIFRNL